MTFEDAIAQTAPGERKRFGPERIDPAYIPPYGYLMYNHDWGDPSLRLDADPSETPQPQKYRRPEFTPPDKPFAASFEGDRDLDLYIASPPYIVVSERLKALLLQEPGLSFNVWPVDAKWHGGVKRFFLLAPRTATPAIEISRTPFVVEADKDLFPGRVVHRLHFGRELVFKEDGLPDLFYEYHAGGLYISRRLAEKLKSEGMTGFAVSFSGADELRA